MKTTEKITHRLALLAGVDLSQAYLDAIAAEIEDLDRIVAELEEFAQGTPWVSQQLQPATSKA
jgi:predicted TPR repeat methyltransferase